MAAKQQRTLFEAMQASRKGLPRGPEISRQPQTAKPTDAGGPVALSQRTGADLGTRLAGRWPLLVLGGVVVVVLVIVTVVHMASRERFDEDKKLLTIEEVAGGETRTDVLNSTGPRSISRTGYTYGTGSGTSGDRERRPDVVPPTGGNTADSTTAGPCMIRIYRVKTSEKADMDEAVAFLKEKGIPTRYELRRGFYFLYSEQRFLTPSAPEAVKLQDRIRALGDEFSRVSGIAKNEFATAYIVTRTPE